jgi:DNA-binding FrmR family transcriptional regulator
MATPHAATRETKTARPASSAVVYLGAEAQEALLNRLARIAGHVRAIARMVETRECADDILLQLTAVKGALNRFASTLVEEELKTCFTTCREDEAADMEVRIDRLVKVLGTMMKQS